MVNSFEDYDAVKYDDDYPKIHIENIRMADTELGWVNFSDKKELLFVNCHFCNMTGNQLSFSEIEDLHIIDCTFDRFADGVLNISECHTVKLSGCRFSNCPTKWQDPDEFTSCRSSCIQLDDIEMVRIENCHFDGCIAYPPMTLDDFTAEYVSAVATLENVRAFRLRDCQFKDCISRPQPGCPTQGCLFQMVDTDCRRAENCVVEHCCPAGDGRLKL